MSSYEYAQKFEIVFWTACIRFMENRRIARFVLGGLLLIGLFVGLSLLLRLLRPVHATLTTPKQANVDQPAGALIPVEDTAFSVSTRQRNLLFVLVDDLAANQPELMGVWLAGQAESVPQVIFIPIFPSTQSEESSGLMELFDLDAAGKPADAFLGSLRERELWWDHYLVADISSLAEMAALASGIDGSGLNLNVTELAASLHSSIERPQEALDLQARIADALCRSAPGIIQKADPEILWGLMTQRVRSDFQLEMIQSAQEKMAIPDEIPVCVFPTLSETSFGRIAD